MIEDRIEGAMRMAVRQRNYRRVRDRALARLANAYPELYKEYLEQEKANDEQQGKKWVDLNGPSAATNMGVRSDATATDTQTSNASENKSYSGGEA